jgi:hypothetical protein
LFGLSPSKCAVRALRQAQGTLRRIINVPS